MKRARVLVVDDKGTFLALFRRILPADTELICAPDGARALELLETERFDVVVTDVRMPGGADGIDVLKKVRAYSDETAVVLMTAYGTIAEAVRAMKLGADDYLTKPFDPDDALAAIERAVERRARGTRSNASPRALLGDSAAMVIARELVRRAARSDANVLILGEYGTGRDLVASLIHEEGPHRARPLVTHVSRLSSELRLEVDFEQAEGGTIYLDEVFDMPPTVHARLLQILDRRTSKPSAFGARVIASGSESVAAPVTPTALRSELEERLAAIRIDLPPLRRRAEDIPVLAASFLARMPGRIGFARSFSTEALDALVAHDWPGNVRQLEITLLAAASVAIDQVIYVRDLPTAVGGRASGEPLPPPLTSLTYREVLAAGRERTTREYLVALMTEVGGNVTHAAERAGVERETFHRLLKRYGVRAEDFRTRP